MLNPKTLPPDDVLLHTRLGDAEALFARVAAQVASGRPRLAGYIRDRLARRHRRRSVNLGNGFALPHAAVPGLSTLRAVYLRSATPIAMGADSADGDDAGDGTAPVTDTLTLLIPSPGLSAEYELLMALTQALQCPATTRALRQARSAATVQRLLADGPALGTAYSAAVAGALAAV